VTHGTNVRPFTRPLGGVCGAQDTSMRPIAHPLDGWLGSVTLWRRFAVATAQNGEQAPMNHESAAANTASRSSTRPCLLRVGYGRGRRAFMIQPAARIYGPSRAACVGVQEGQVSRPFIRSCYCLCRAYTQYQCEKQIGDTNARRLMT